MSTQSATKKAPVVFIVFNRPDTTARVFDAIRDYAPEKLFVIADGPRESRPNEMVACLRTRAVTEQIDWNCDVSRLYRNKNFGCRHNVSEGLDWAFDQTETAIILEDDCLPNPTLFCFCEELLDRYRDNSSVGMIGGVNFQFGRNPIPESYYFSRHCHIWGWATWRRAWRLFDAEMTGWKELRGTDWLRRQVGSSTAAWYWRAIFDDCASSEPGSLNSWAVPWTYSCWKEGMSAILPSRNLVSNIGFGVDSTHTWKANQFANMKAYSMRFPMLHPKQQSLHRAADNYTERIHYYGQNRLQWIIWTLRLPLSLRWMRKVHRAIRCLKKDIGMAKC